MQWMNRYKQENSGGSRSLNKKGKNKRLKTATRRINATTSCLCALFDKPIRSLAYGHALRKTNQGSCLCSTVVELASFISRTYKNRSISWRVTLSKTAKDGDVNIGKTMTLITQVKRAREYVK